ncbi:c-type cytochrome [Flavobacterium maritimum]|jgi:mono/diheme cytochrome c family protein|uniref:c-type cytochrome n=1 Tax=Flavobacterium maritimum TaxID=3149042 RepID=UPI0032B55EF9
MKNKYLFLVVIALIAIGSNKINAQNSIWVAPDHSKNLKNPFMGNEKAAVDGKKIFDQMCVLCHGEQGKGNGAAGLTLETKPANFLELKVVNETDGEIFWKITNGKSPMASYEELLTDDQRWKLVNYIRVLGANTK